MIPPLKAREYMYILTALFVAAAITWAACHAQVLVPLNLKRRLKISMSGAVRTGDLLLFSTSMCKTSDIQKLATASPFTHVGIAFVDRSGIPFVWESRVGSGYALNKLSSRLREPGEACMVRHLNKPVSPYALETIIRAELGTPYAFNFWRGLLSQWCSYVRVPEAGDDVGKCCSNMVAYVYVRLRVMTIRANQPGNSLMPGDFAKPEQPGDMLYGYEFSPNLYQLSL